MIDYAAKLENAKEGSSMKTNKRQKSRARNEREDEVEKTECEYAQPTHV